MRGPVTAACAAVLVVAAGLATAPFASASPAGSTYRVDVVNHSGFGLDEVDLAVGRYSDPVIRLITQRHITSGATATFDLGACSDVHKFAASAFIGNREVLHTSDIDPRPSCHTQIEITHT
ncbi:hypothetical protein ABH930_002531 [Kitasatospora sp. GAS204A]|uniref:hypothetical protein n=1 Tax=unclassified Kitasatospora TaxID=2633591 RepID=UPI0024763DC7|nr:hypothetical protein [Kitasatospora sp. GAS204B]MDH6119170.1 hypothetical protein [Kitasatospora sp. GAS204B]